MRRVGNTHDRLEIADDLGAVGIGALPGEVKRREALIGSGIEVGSTLDEAKSWGKINSKATCQMAFVEPTVALPLLIGGLLQKNLAAQRPRLSYQWEGEVLKKMVVQR